jgi:5-amino-6-(5-phosphoribosylamino)uracil reductase
MDRPYVLLSCAVSIDGYLDDSGPERLVLSSDADLDRVDEVRAGVDAILVGANTVRRDNPRLLVRSQARQRARVSRGLPPNPVKVTVTRSGDLDPDARFFTTGESAKLVYVASDAADKARHLFGGRSMVIDAGESPELSRILPDLAGRGVHRLMVEGGSGILSWFLSTGLADELHLVVAPRFVADPRAPRWLRLGAGPPGAPRLLDTERLDDCVLLRYALRPPDLDRPDRRPGGGEPRDD